MPTPMPFGPVTVTPLCPADSLQKIGAGSSVWQIVEQFLRVSEGVAERIAQGPGGLLLLVGIPGRENTGALYLYQNSSRFFFSLDFAAQDTFSPIFFDSVVQLYSLDKLIAETDVPAKDKGAQRRRPRHRNRRADVHGNARQPMQQLQAA